MVAGLSHEVQEEMEVMQSEEGAAEDFAGHDEVAEVGAGEIIAGVIVEAFDEGFGVAGELGVF